MPRQNIQPATLATRVVDGHVPYSHMVVAEGKRMIFVAGQLARDRQSNIVGHGEMRVQLRQVGENIKAALEAASEVSPSGLPCRNRSDSDDGLRCMSRAV
jgi:2-iminobutanoate/2-iminopropanoate deaminase